MTRQEFLSTHTFTGDLFQYPLVLVALSHTAAMFLSIAALRTGGNQIVIPGASSSIEAEDLGVGNAFRTARFAIFIYNTQYRYLSLSFGST